MAMAAFSVLSNTVDEPVVDVGAVSSQSPPHEHNRRALIPKAAMFLYFFIFIIFDCFLCLESNIKSYGKYSGGYQYVRAGSAEILLRVHALTVGKGSEVLNGCVKPQ